ncbi:pentapeptide MXKDX repeat protein [Neorhizobium sp. CSC1952]|uniref:pentapeptide MXKDX repeat protein n=1 Tax=Neorhizobium sp. CSC1952 TaxID=2978974 RepID=UPI0025A67FA3|nr:pentapeptide MXKDX repeat protein [Rhizobium sp. CSC1952]WJR67820.1 pentapeptide MXKDX repeat protein [Rhizobium sp. CSC1952]
MIKLLSSLAACTVVAGLSFAAAANAQTSTGADTMKKDNMQSGAMSKDSMKTDTMSMAGTKTACMDKAGMEKDSMKKAEMMKACDAMK